jgi:NAD(P)-dependent dehydrogenase (short-subunit alcohol dehydrogenase family)
MKGTSMDAARFQNTGFIVAGGTHGVGRAIVLAAAQQGASVVFCGHSESEAAGTKVIATARAWGALGRLVFVPADVSCEPDVERLFDVALEQLPGLHVLVHSMENTAAPKNKRMLQTSLVDWNTELATKLRAPFLLSRRAIEEFLAAGAGGRIVYTADAAAKGSADSVIGAATQTALHSFIRSVAKEYGRYGMTCNAVLIQRDSTTDLPAIGSSTWPPAQAPRSPLHDPDHLETVSEAALFLASSEASFVTGEMLHVAAPYIF